MSKFAGTWTFFKILSFGSTSPIKDQTTISFTDDSAGSPAQFKFTPAGSGDEVTLPIATKNPDSDRVSIERSSGQNFRVVGQILSAGQLSLMLGLVANGRDEGSGIVNDSNTDSFVAVKTSG